MRRSAFLRNMLAATLTGFIDIKSLVPEVGPATQAVMALRECDARLMDPAFHDIETVVFNKLWESFREMEIRHAVEGAR